MILAGGMGKRLRPITDYLPKSLVPIENIPIIEWQIIYLKKFGIKDFVICTGYRSEQIIDYLKGKSLGVNIQYSIEKKPLGTGGAIKKADKYINEDSFYAINGDVITNLDLEELNSKRNSIAVIPLRSAFGLVHLKGNKVERFEEKPQMFNDWMNAGVYHLETSVIKSLPKIGNIETTTFPRLAKNGTLYAIKYNKVFWHSIDSHKNIDDCVKEMKLIQYEKFLSQ